MNPEVLVLRPHHILDMIRNLGNRRPLVPHPYGHLVHEITPLLREDPDRLCRLVARNDAVCGPCRMLDSRGLCTDVLSQLEKPVSKQEYNDGLDRRLLAFLGIRDGETMSLRDFLERAGRNPEALISLCTHPGEPREVRMTGLSRGYALLGLTFPET